MSLLDRLRRRHVRLTLGAVPLPTLIPDAAAALRDIFSRHTRKGYRLVQFWDVLVISADEETYRMQFYPLVQSPQDALAVARRGRHIVRFVPIVADPDELDRLMQGLASKEQFEMDFQTDARLMSGEGLRSLGGD